MRFFSLKSFLILILFSSTIYTTENINVGISLPISGPSKQMGESLLAGIKPAVNNINSNGGIAGKQLKLFILDDAYNPEKTIKNTIQFIKFNNVDILFSYVGTPTTHKLSPILFKYNIPIFFPLTGAHIFHDKKYKNHIIHSRPSYWDESTSILAFLSSLGLSKFSVYYQKDAFGQSGLMGIRNKANASNLSPVNSISYNRGKSINDDFSLDAQLLMETDPEAIILISSYEASAGIIKEIRKTSNIPVIMISFSDPHELINLIGKNPDNLSGLYYSNVLPNDQDLINQYEKITNLKYNPLSFEGFINTYFLKEILESHKGNLKNFYQEEFEYKNKVKKSRIQTYTANGWIDV